MIIAKYCTWQLEPKWLRKCVTSIFTSHCSSFALRVVHALDDLVAIPTAYWTVFGDHPRCTFHRSQRAPRLDQTDQRRLRFTMMSTCCCPISRSHATSLRHIHSHVDSRNHRREHNSRHSFSGHQILLCCPNGFLQLVSSSLSLRQSSSLAASAWCMQCLHQLMDGRCVISCSILPCSFWLSRIVFGRGLPFSELLSDKQANKKESNTTTSHAQHRPPSRSSSRILPFLVQFTSAQRHTCEQTKSLGMRIAFTPWHDHICMIQCHAQNVHFGKELVMGI